MTTTTTIIIMTITGHHYGSDLDLPVVSILRHQHVSRPSTQTTKENPNKILFKKNREKQQPKNLLRNFLKGVFNGFSHPALLMPDFLSTPHLSVGVVKDFVLRMCHDGTTTTTTTTTTSHHHHHTTSLNVCKGREKSTFTLHFITPIKARQ